MFKQQVPLTGKVFANFSTNISKYKLLETKEISFLNLKVFDTEKRKIRKIALYKSNKLHDHSRNYLFNTINAQLKIKQMLQNIMKI